MSLIEIKGLKKSFGSLQVLKGIDLSVEPGERIAIIGGSGCGKSVFLRCICLLEKPTGGQIFIDGREITAKDAKVDRIRRSMGMVFQKFHLFSEMNVMDNLCLAPVKLLGMSREQAEIKAMGLLEQVGLPSLANRMPRVLSGGQQQRVAICRCLMMEPKVLLMDEPTSALDPSMVGEVLAVIRLLAKQGMTMLIVTHEMDFAREMATRVLYLADGGIYEQGTAAEIFDHPKRDNTRAFIRKIKYFSYDITGPDFDLMQMQGGIQQFGEKYGLTQRRINQLQICCEELIYEMLEHCYSLDHSSPGRWTADGESGKNSVDMQIEVSYAEINQAAEIFLTCGGAEYNPFDQEEDALGVTILRNMAKELDYQRKMGRNSIRIIL